MSIYPDTRRVNIVIGASLLKAAKAHARNNGIASFSEYVARLCVADLRKNRSAARSASRFLPERQERSLALSAKPNRK